MMPNYESRFNYYLRQWVDGYPMHNYTDDECLIDFSCCYPELFTKDKYMREIISHQLLER